MHQKALKSTERHQKAPKSIKKHNQFKFIKLKKYLSEKNNYLLICEIHRHNIYQFKIHRHKIYQFKIH